jgi:CTP-dependent riboflavin kinase
VTLTGTVVAGFGWHKNNMQPWRRLPFKPYPGTLNVKVGKKHAKEFMESVETWIEHNGRWYPYRLGTIAGVPVAVTNSESKSDEVEVLAAIRLRNLPLSDGDIVSIAL